MPLVDVRRNFITYSGRYDLIVNRTTYADNGQTFIFMLASILRHISDNV